MTDADQDLVDLDEIVPDEAILAETRRTRATTPLTRALLALVVVALAFLGGALVDRWQRPSTSSAPNLQGLISQFRGGRGGGTGNPASGGTFPGLGGATGGGATVGTVKLVDGNTLYVQGATGDVVRVTTNGQTTVTVSKPGRLSDLKVGTNVTVQGTATADGSSMSATSISPSSGLGANRLGGNNIPAAGG